MADLHPSDPATIGPYRLLGRIGTGGMGIVFLVVGPDGSKAALKLIRAELADDPAFRARFRREVEAGQRVGGVCNAKYVAADLQAERPYLVTEYIPGGNLADFVAMHGPLTGDQPVSLAVGLAEALVAMSSVGVIHRDLKPSNVLMGATGPKVVDFGIAHAADGTALTQTGLTVGSPSWMAPEQAIGQSGSAASDVFSWGATVAFAATGRSPFGEGRPEAVLYRVVHEPPDLVGLDPRLEPMVRQALEKDPDRRPTADGLLLGLVRRAMAGVVPVGDSDAMTTAVLERTWRHGPPKVPLPGAAPAEVDPPEVGAEPGTHRGLGWLGVAAFVLVAALIAGGVILANKSDSKQSGSITTPVPKPGATSTTNVPLTTTSPRVTTSGPSTTTVMAFAPWTEGGGLAPGINVSGHLSNGSCWEASSADVADQDAWRCSSNNNIYDPCFAPGGESNVTVVACAASPWSDVNILNLTQPLSYSASGMPTGGSSTPWFLELANGDRCGVTTGTVGEAGGVTLNYGCGSGGASTPDTSTNPWTVQYLPNDSHVLSQVDVSSAWQ